MVTMNAEAIMQQQQKQPQPQPLKLPKGSHVYIMTEGTLKNILTRSKRTVKAWDAKSNKWLVFTIKDEHVPCRGCKNELQVGDKVFSRILRSKHKHYHFDCAVQKNLLVLNSTSQEEQ